MAAAAAPPEDPSIGRLHAAKLQEYVQAATQLRALTDIRFKLLGFLPLGTLASILATSSSQLQSEPLIDAFGLVVVLCIATYNKRNDQLYDELVGVLAALERDLGLRDGSYAQRPVAWLRFGPWHVNHRWPVGLVYAASASAWAASLVRALPWRHVDQSLRDALPAIAIGIVFVIWSVVIFVEKHKRRELRTAIEALRDLRELDDLEQGVETSPVLMALVDATVCKRRFAHQRAAWSPAYATDARERARVLAAVIDLPARWIHDVWTKRR